MSVLTTWPALRAHPREKLVRDLEFVDGLMAGWEEKPVSRLAALFNRAPELLAQVLTFGGADAAAEHMTLLYGPLARLVSEPSAIVKNPTSVAEALSYMCVAECVGLTLPEGTEAGAQQWLMALAEVRLAEPIRRSMAFACTALGQPALVAVFDRGPSPKPTTESHEIYGMNVFGVARHLAQAAMAQAPSTTVESAWWSMLESFPMAAFSGGARWLDLVWASRAMMTQFEGRAVSDVGVYLPALIKELD